MSEIPDTDPLAATAARLSFAPGGLHVPADLSMGVVARTALSISSADALRSCPARWASEKLLRADEDPFSPAYIGNGGHDVLENLMQQPAKERTVDAAIAILNDLVQKWADGSSDDGDHRPFLNDPVDRTRWVAAVWNGIQTLWDIRDPASFDVWDTEFKIETTVDGIPISGYIDLVERVADKKGNPALGIGDWKTGKHKDRRDRQLYGDTHGDQIRVYAEALEAMLAELPDGHPDKGLKVVEGRAYYTKHGKVEKAALSAPYRKATMTAHAAAWTIHNDVTASGEYPTSPSGLCTYCPLVRMCPSRSESVKWEKVPSTALSPVRTPIGRPFTEALPQTISFGDQWDTLFEQADPYWDAIRSWDGLDEVPARSHDLFRPQAAANPLARIEDGIFVADIDPFAPAARLESQAPAHTSSESTTPPRLEESTMTTNSDQAAAFFEDVPYKADPMNVASYAHLSANKIVNIALAQLRDAGVPAYALTQELLRSTADVLWNVLTTVQDQLIGHRDLQSAVSRNLLYSLREVLILEPMPILADGGARFATADEITQWGAMTVARLSTMVSLSIGLVHTGGNLGAASHFRGTSTSSAQGVQMHPGAPQASGGAPIQSAYFDQADLDQSDYASVNDYDPAFQ